MELSHIHYAVSEWIFFIKRIISFVIYIKKTLRIENSWNHLVKSSPFIYLFSKCKLFFHTVQFCLDECNELQYHDPVLVSYVECISSIHFLLFGQSDQKRKNQLTCLFTFFQLHKTSLTEKIGWFIYFHRNFLYYGVQKFL